MVRFTHATPDGNVEAADAKLPASDADKNYGWCRVVGVRWEPAIFFPTTFGIETSRINHDFIQETSWIMCGFGVDGGHMVGILESG
jgi:hypothetical protein